MAMLMRLQEQALNGDVRAQRLLLTLAVEHSAEKEAQSAERRLFAEENDILARYAADVLREAGVMTADDTDEEGSDAE